MKRRAGPLRLLSAMAALAAAPAQATIDRVWLSRNGVDSPACGGAPAPCRTLQYAHDNIVSAGGVIDIMDAGGYGPIVIGKSLSIINDGAGVAGVLAPANGEAVLIQTQLSSDTIYLRGLTIEGAGAGSRAGVRLEGQGGLTIEKCLVRGFKGQQSDGFGYGIWIKANGPSKISIADTTIVEIGEKGSGMLFSQQDTGSLQAVIERVTLTKTGDYGLLLSDFGDAATGRAEVTVRNSIAQGNLKGFAVHMHNTATGKLTLDGVAAHNNGIGVDNLAFDQSASTVEIAYSSVTENDLGVATHFGAVSYTHGNNYIHGNVTKDIDGAALVAVGDR